MKSKKNAVNVKIYDIEWDDDGEDVDLPTKVDATIEYNDDDDYLSDVISDWLSNEYGYCVDDFTYEFLP